MADASYDVVLIGGGNKGLIAAMYLTKYGGMSVGIFEDKHELGGGWCSEESPAPGFLADHCSFMHSYEYHLCVWEDFPEWEEYGAKPIDRLVNTATIFKEDNSWCGLYNAAMDPTREKTAKLWARFSERDAEKLLWLWDKTQKYIIPNQREYFWNPPPPNEPYGLEKLINNPDSGIDPHWATMTYPQVLKEMFESPEVQMLFARQFHAIGIMPHAYGGGLAVATCLVISQRMIAIPGGIHALAHASHRVILENGGKVFTQSKVDKIIIENGTAKGIRLADGTEVEAKRAVLSGVDPYQLCVELIGEDHISHDIIRKIKALETDWTVIAWYTWALKEPPRYLAEDFDPDIKHANTIALTKKSYDDLLDEGYRRKLGMWYDPERMNMTAHERTNAPGHPDVGYAPPGMCSDLTEQWVLPAWARTEAEWKVLEKQIAEDFINKWQQYAPNMTWDNVVGYVPITPYFISKHCRNWGPAGNWCVIDNSPAQVGRWRPIPELASGRMPIKNLYATGTAWPPMGSAYSWQGYNIYKVMAEDFGLKKPWEEKGRPY